MAGDFETFKKEIIDIQKKLEIGSLLHLYIKAGDYDDIINVFKNTGNFRWSIENGLLNEDILSRIPAPDLENNQVYNDTRTETNPTGKVVIREGADVLINMTDDNRCKVICLGGLVTINSKGRSMVEIETYNDSFVYVVSEDDSYCHASGYHISLTDIALQDNSICKAKLTDVSEIIVNIQDDGWLNAEVREDAWLKIKGKTKNITISKDEKSKVSRQTGADIKNDNA